MSKRARTTIIVFLTVFLVLCGITVLLFRLPYLASRFTYGGTSASFTEQQEPQPAQPVSTEPVEVEKELPKESEKPEPKRDLVLAPIKVDFDALLAINEDIIGWIYCEDTVIDYPVLYGVDNEKYLHTLYNKQYSAAGSIFLDAYNTKAFVDSTNVLYGHHMADRSMFATLDEWQKQDYFDEHPVMWLLTPTQDYRVDLFSAYTVSAYDEAYTLFGSPGPSLDAWLKIMKSRSRVKCEMELDSEAKYVLLSTCAYVFEDARSVVHGMLVPVDSAGGKPLPSPRPEAPRPAPTPVTPSPTPS